MFALTIYLWILEGGKHDHLDDFSTLLRENNFRNETSIVRFVVWASTHENLFLFLIFVKRCHTLRSRLKQSKRSVTSLMLFLLFFFCFFRIFFVRHFEEVEMCLCLTALLFVTYTCIDATKTKKKTFVLRNRQGNVFGIMFRFFFWNSRKCHRKINWCDLVSINFFIHPHHRRFEIHPVVDRHRQPAMRLSLHTNNNYPAELWISRYVENHRHLFPFFRPGAYRWVILK